MTRLMSKRNKLTSRRAVAPVIATLLLVAIAVVGGSIVFVFSQGFFSSAQISGAPQIESLQITGYDARDVADDLESKSPYAAEYERKSSAKAEIADQIRELSLALKDVPEEDWRTLSDLRSKIQDLQAAMIDAGDRGGWN